MPYVTKNKKRTFARLPLPPHNLHGSCFISFIHTFLWSASISEWISHRNGGRWREGMGWGWGYEGLFESQQSVTAGTKRVSRADSFNGSKDKTPRSRGCEVLLLRPGGGVDRVWLSNLCHRKTSTTAALLGSGPSLARLWVATRAEDNRGCFVTGCSFPWG